MRTIAIDVPGVCLSVTRLYATLFAHTAERIEVLLGMETSGYPRLDLRLDFVFEIGPHFHHGFDAAFAKLLCVLVVLYLD